MESSSSPTKDPRLFRKALLAAESDRKALLPSSVPKQLKVEASSTRTGTSSNLLIDERTISGGLNGWGERDSTYGSFKSYSKVRQAVGEWGSKDGVASSSSTTSTRLVGIPTSERSTNQFQHSRQSNSILSPSQEVRLFIRGLKDGRRNLDQYRETQLHVLFNKVAENAICAPVEFLTTKFNKTSIAYVQVRSEEVAIRCIELSNKVSIDDQVICIKRARSDFALDPVVNSGRSRRRYRHTRDRSEDRSRSRERRRSRDRRRDRKRSESRSRSSARSTVDRSRSESRSRERSRYRSRSPIKSQKKSRRSRSRKRTRHTSSSPSPRPRSHRRSRIRSRSKSFDSRSSSPSLSISRKPPADTFEDLILPTFNPPRTGDNSRSFKREISHPVTFGFLTSSEARIALLELEKGGKFSSSREILKLKDSYRIFLLSQLLPGDWKECDNLGSDEEAGVEKSGTKKNWLEILEMFHILSKRNEEFMDLANSIGV